MKNIIEIIFGRKNFIRITLPVLLIIALIIIGFFSFQKPKTTTLTPNQAKIRAENFINKYLMRSGNAVVIKSISTEYGLYKLNIKLTNSDVNSYLTKDGKLFFPQALNINQITAKAIKAQKPNSNTTSATVKLKNNKPDVDLFIMSYCPYGTQIEKGILPVLSTLGKTINFRLKFVNYSMHGPKELTENTRQYCIQKNEPQKLDNYLACFLQAGDSNSCVTSVKINKTQLSACMASTNQKYKITSNAKDHLNYRGRYPSFPIDQADNIKYNVLGSPTLIINGQQIDSNRDSASLLKTICSAFNSQPKECQTVLSSVSPAPGLGTVPAATPTTANQTPTPSASASCGG